MAGDAVTKESCMKKIVLTGFTIVTALAAVQAQEKGAQN